MTNRPPLDDRWHSRDFPVLIEAARLIDQDGDFDGAHIAQALDLEISEVRRAIAALKQAGYLEDRPLVEVPRYGDSLARHTTAELTERGRRTVGIWPSGQSVDSLVEALRQAEDLVDDPDEKTLIRRAAGAVGSVSREVLTDVMAAVIKSQAGL